MSTDEAFALCDAVFGRLTDPHPRGYPISNYPSAERIVVAVWHFAGVIDNSGLDGFLSRDIPGDPGFSVVAACFAAIGVEPATNAIADAIQFVTDDGGLVLNCSDRRERLGSLPDGLLNRLNGQFWDASDAIVFALARHIRENGLDPE